MKLYATVTSERASKGQGGNKYIRVSFTVGSTAKPEKIGTIYLQVEGDRWTLNASDIKHSSQHLDSLYSSYELASGDIETKGKRQKGECTHIFTTAVYENTKLQGYKCNACGELQEVNPQYRKNTK